MDDKCENIPNSDFQKQNLNSRTPRELFSSIGYDELVIVIPILPVFSIIELVLKYRIQSRS